MTQHRTRRARPWPTLLVAGAVSATLAACGGGSGDDDPIGGGSGDDSFDVDDVNFDGITDTPIGEPDATGVQAYDIDGDGDADTEIAFGEFDVNGDGFADFDVDGDGNVDRSVAANGELTGYDLFDLGNEPVNGFDGVAVVDADNGALGPDVITPDGPDGDNPCGSQPDGDPVSGNFDWNDNCQVSAANQFATSQYTKGIQRVVWCSGFQGNSPASTVDAFADGIFGANTQAAVEAFQEANIGGEAGDGVVGPNTWGALQGVLGPLLAADVPAAPGSDELAFEAYTVAGERCGSDVLFYYEVPDDDDDDDLGGWTLADPVGSDQRSPFTIDRP